MHRLAPIGRRGIGQFAGAIDPNDPTGAIVGQLRGSLTGDPGIRLAKASARGSRVYSGTSFSTQQFIKQAGGTNSAEALDVHANAPLKRNRSRALGQFRGLPEMSNGDV